MIDWIPLLYDLCVVGLILYFISISARRGFARTLIELIGYFLSLTAANFCAKFLSSTLYERLLRPTVVEKVGEKLVEAGVADLAADVQTVLGQIPVQLEQLLKKFGVRDQFLGNLEGLVSSTKPLPEAITDHVVGPMVVNVIQLILFMIFLSLCMFLVRKFSWTLSGLRKIPLIGPANTLLGGVVGALEGLLTVGLLANLLQIIIGATGGGFRYLNSDILEATSLLKRFLF